MMKNMQEGLGVNVVRDGPVLLVQKLLLVLMSNRIKEKQTLTVEDHALRAQHVMILFRIKERLALTVEDHVLLVPLAMMTF